MALMRDHALPEDPDDTAEGNAAHFYLAALLRGSPPAVGSLDPAGTVIDQNMVDGANVMFTEALPFLFQPDRYEVLVEHRFPAGSLLGPEVWGTPDLVIIDRQERVFRVMDFKYGWRAVDEFFNPQLVCYAALVAEYIGMPLSRWRAELSICQPRVYLDGGPFRTWAPDWGTLIEYWATLARMAGIAAKALDSEDWPDMAATAGSHCRDCANHACEVFRKSVYGSIAYAFAPMPSTGPVRAEDAGMVLAQMREAAAQLKTAIAGMEGDLLARTAAGQSIPGVVRDYSTSREVWTLDVETTATLADAHGVDIRKADLLTPEQARKKGLDAAVISQLSHRPPGSPKIRVVSASSVAKAFR